MLSNILELLYIYFFSIKRVFLKFLASVFTKTCYRTVIMNPNGYYGLYKENNRHQNENALLFNKMRPEDFLRGLPVFNPHYTYFEFGRTMFERTFSLNASNSKKLVFGFSPFQLTTQQRVSDGSLKADFDFILRIVDSKFGHTVSIFGEELESFYAALERMKLHQNATIGEVLFTSKHYVLKQSDTGYYEFSTKEGKKVFKIFAESVLLILQYRAILDQYKQSFADIHLLRLFVDIIERFYRADAKKCVVIGSHKDILTNMQVFADADEEDKIMYYEICLTYSKLIHQMLDFVKTM